MLCLILTPQSIFSKSQGLVTGSHEFLFVAHNLFLTFAINTGGAKGTISPGPGNSGGPRAPGHYYYSSIQSPRPL